MRPFTKGRNRLIAAPLIKLQNVGGEYRISGELDVEGGEGDIERSSGPELEYCSLSDRIVMPDSARAFSSAISTGRIRRWWRRSSDERVCERSKVRSGSGEA
jgi:hypothetical protein